ncbi:MAG: hypothetical protein MZV63_09955 [Marinilabiliales bacterium]|nr:hypothetical protein [Marinilabiliales bacterium]
MCKSKLFYDSNILVFFKNHVFAKNANVGHLLFNILRDIIISEEKNLNREIFGCLSLDTLSTVGEFYTALFQQFLRVFAQAGRFSELQF